MPTIAGTLTAGVALGGTHIITTTELGFVDLNDTSTTFLVATSRDNLTGAVLSPGSQHGWVTLDGVITTTFTSQQLASGRVAFVHDGTANADAWFRVTDYDGQLYSTDFKLFNFTVTSDHVDNDSITGTSAGEAISTGAGNDVINGMGGDDVLNGGAGADTMAGGTGNDTFFIDNPNDVVIENSGEGIDLVESSINYALGNNVENLVLLGTANLNGTGNALDNKIAGNAGNNILSGGAGNNVIDGGAGQDTALYNGNAANSTLFTFNSILCVYDRTSHGLDQLTSIETLQFADTSVSAAAAPSFDPLEYLASNPDLLLGLGSNTQGATQHYFQHGLQEDRSIASFDAL
eukprot:gene30865-39755_t